MVVVECRFGIAREPLRCRVRSAELKANGQRALRVELIEPSQVLPHYRAGTSLRIGLFEVVSFESGE